MGTAGGAPAGAGRRETVAAVIDVGSNSVLLLAVAVGADGRARPVDAALETTRLGTRLTDGGALDPAARARTVAAVEALAVRARRAGAERVWAFATAAVRRAGDGAAFAREVERAAGVPVEVLSGAREAALAYAAVAHGLPGLAGPLLVVDVGGGTTELTLGRDETVLETASLPLGALALSEAGAGRVAECVERALAGCDLLARAATSGGRFAASGGTATALAALDLGLICYDARRVHGHVLGRAALQALVGRVAALPPAALAALAGLDPGRAAILPAGAVILERVVEAARASAVTVSDHGVRHAYLRERLAEAGVRADLGELWS